MIESRPRSLWRYLEWLPFEGTPVLSVDTGFTPLVEAPRVAKRLGVPANVVLHVLPACTPRTITTVMIMSDVRLRQRIAAWLDAVARSKDGKEG